MDANAEIRCWIADAHARTRSLVESLEDEELSFPYDYILTPVLWELGHVAWFQEYWFLVGILGQSFGMEDATERFDSRTVPHVKRWHLELPSRESIMDWLARVEERSLRAYEAGNIEGDALEALVLSILHHDMHNEAWSYQWQTLGYHRPQTRKELEGRPGLDAACAESGGGDGDLPLRRIAVEESVEGNASFPAGTILLGVCSDGGFHFDNEEPPIELGYGAFDLSRRLVTQGEFRAFVEECGYERDDYWSAEGRAWMRESGAVLPCYWRKTEAGDYERRRFDEWIPVADELPMSHVNWFEAEAWCRFAGRRLPSEIEWEVAACCGSEKKKRYPWGDEVHPDGRANLSWFSTDVMVAGSLAGGRTAQGVAQLFGDVWEWTSSSFEPYPGFVPGTRGRFYREYSEPAFGTRKVLRGGSWATTARLLSMSHRNFFEPFRNDIISGFRSCSLA
jgi:ergothioneine biosynthesis protein EgtB